MISEDQNEQKMQLQLLAEREMRAKLEDMVLRTAELIRGKNLLLQQLQAALAQLGK